METSAMSYCEKFKDIDLIHMPSGVIGRVNIEYDENCCAPTQDVMFSFATKQHFQMFDTESFLKFIHDCKVADVFSVSQSLVQRIEKSQKSNIELAGKQIALAHMAGHRFYVSGSGHSHTMAEEFYGRAGGLAFTVPILTSELTLTEHPTKSSYIERLEGYASILAELYEIASGDVVLIASHSGRNAYPVELALEAKARGAYVIGVCCVAQSRQVESRHSSKKKLMDVADLVIDNCGYFGDVSLDVDGVMMAAMSSLSNGVISQSISVACAKELIKNGHEIEVFSSLNVDGTNKNDEYFKKYTRQFVCQNK